MRRGTFLGGVALAVAVAGLGGAAAAFGRGGDDGPSVTGPDADRAVAAALSATGGGKANAVERDNEKGATWEVEVTRPDGTTVDVRLRADYSVVVIEPDSEAGDAPDSGQQPVSSG